MIPATTKRVTEHTDEKINERIRQQTEANIAKYSKAGPVAIDRRINALDREWDVERMLEANAASVVLLGVALGAMVHPLFYILPALVGGFLLLHAIQGWCPPLPVLRRMGFRTQTEIDHEKYALKAMRGDFDTVAVHSLSGRGLQIREALQAVER
jgi:hypothetical protein